ncbi:hypothetical protein KCU65_g5167, partial [Aureobasidium melanogenum]
MPTAASKPDSPAADSILRLHNHQVTSYLNSQNHLPFTAMTIKLYFSVLRHTVSSRKRQQKLTRWLKPVGSLHTPDPQKIKIEAARRHVKSSPKLRDTKITSYFAKWPFHERGGQKATTASYASASHILIDPCSDAAVKYLFRQQTYAGSKKKTSVCIIPPTVLLNIILLLVDLDPAQS